MGIDEHITDISANEVSYIFELVLSSGVARDTHSIIYDKLQCLFKLVNMANTIFSKLEKKLKKFDVQQMHSNGELASEFMVMSGIPNKNGIQISQYLVLDI